MLFIYVVAMYRNHTKPIMEFSVDLKNFLQKGTLTNEKIVLAGDLNTDLLKQARRQFCD